MAERTWLAVALSLLVWYLYASYFSPPPPAPQTTTTQSATPTPAEPASKTSVALFGQPLRPEAAISLPSGRLMTAFSKVGGKLAEAQVTSYREGIKADTRYITPVSASESPFTDATLFSDPALRDLSTALYDFSQQGQTVRFSKSLPGVTFEKDYALGVTDYLMHTTYRLKFSDPKRAEWGYLAIPVGLAEYQYSTEDPLRAWEVVAFQNDSVHRKTTESLDEGEVVQQGTTAWIAFSNRYFTTALVNASELNPDVVFVKSKEFTGGYLRYPLNLKQGQTELVLKVHHYIGPKDIADLAAVPGLKQVVDYGFFSWLAYPLLEVLRFFYRFVHNYGLAIILLTISVRLIFYPLSLKASRSMKAMQRLQPQIQALKEKYKEDPQRFNQEQLNLFKTHKVNPLGGCLPMLVQLPVFFALYSVLGTSIELFHAPFFGWIQDLSSKDPYYVFPVLMGISMFVQQKMTPSVGMDPMQQKMMLMMPVVFTFVMLNLPSGLTVYIFLSTLLQIAQQFVINREPHPGAALVAAKPSPQK